MTDLKITQLTEATTTIGADLAEIVINVSTTPVNRKILMSNLALGLATLMGIADGWVSAGETWTRVTDNTFTVVGDVTTKYTAGVKIKWTQTTVKYGYVQKSVYGAPNTTVTIIPNTDYLMVAGAVSANYYSRADTPLGFPDWFNYTPVWASTGTQPVVNNGTLEGRFKVHGHSCLVVTTLLIGTTTTLGTGNYTISLPAQASNVKTNGQFLGWTYMRDTGVNNYASLVAVAANATVMSFNIESNWATNVNNFTPTVPVAWSNGDSWRNQVEYELA